MLSRAARSLTPHQATAGAIFLAFNVAPTEEMILLAFRMTAWHALALALVSGAAAVLSARDTGQPGVVVTDPVAALDAEPELRSSTRNAPSVRTAIWRVLPNI